MANVTGAERRGHRAVHADFSQYDFCGNYVLLFGGVLCNMILVLRACGCPSRGLLSRKELAMAAKKAAGGGKAKKAKKATKSKAKKKAKSK